MGREEDKYLFEVPYRSLLSLAPLHQALLCNPVLMAPVLGLVQQHQTSCPAVTHSAWWLPQA